MASYWAEYLLLINNIFFFTENPAINYRFHLILAAVLQKEGITLNQLDKALNENLDRTAPNRFQRDAPHQKMRLGRTLQTARKKTTDEHYLMSYLLDRWSRVTGGDRKPHVLKKMFEHKPRIITAIDKLWYFNFKLVLYECSIVTKDEAL